MLNFSEVYSKNKHIQTAQLSSILVNLDPISGKKLEKNVMSEGGVLFSRILDCGWIFIKQFVLKKSHCEPVVAIDSPVVFFRVAP